MLRKVFTIFLYVLLALSAGLFFAFEKYPGVNLYVKTILGIAPCQKPLAYSFGTIDPQFGVSEKYLQTITAKAAAIWNTPIKRQLLVYIPDSKLKINLIYDYRQDTTNQLGNISATIDSNKTAYENFKRELDKQKIEYLTKKSELEKLTADLNILLAKFNKDVAYWNGRKGAPRDVYQTLNQTKIELEDMSKNIELKQGELNQFISNFNSQVIQLNQMAKNINYKVDAYNQIGENAPKIFDQGTFVSDQNGTRINIYEFRDENKLTRVLAHELGHGLGLEHINNPEAIMYELNESDNLIATTDDIAELKTLCQIK